MPHISVSLYPGRTEEMKKDMANKIVQCLTKEYGWKNNDISVSFDEVDANDFTAKIKDKIKEEEIVSYSDYIKEGE